MLRTLCAIALIACLPSSAFAQRAANQTTAAPTISTAKFVREASVGNQFEIRSSQLALTRSLSPQVRQFARRMIRDHSQAERQLRATVRKVGLKQPGGLDAKHIRMLGELRSARGRPFEGLYVNMQTEGHLGAVALLGNYARNGQNQQLRQYAGHWLPVFQEHLRLVEQLEPRVAGLSPRASAQWADKTTAAQKISTAEFVRELNAGSRLQLRSSELALTRSDNPQVREFARRMIRDHQREDRKLRAVLRKAGIRQPEGLDPKYMRMLADLRAARGRAFDRSYVNGHAIGHSRAMALFRDYARNGKNVELRQYADQMLPTLQQHGRLLQQLEPMVAARE